ncbi:hypothetical protein TSAR_012657 [Trichomalopsis sarcophagae]|uniref:Phosphoglycolate phosphatase n=1 Tax=Trichomalopsis sarcophagae TaxID=543379 RepID=A0A232FJU3_9HYME|nr:hypothetical protein TSAR_012657 [Trichomalopsis sarcophagae]
MEIIFHRTMAAVNLKSLSSKEIIEFFDSFDTVLTDCDGVLWMEMTPLHQSAEVMNTFQELGKRVFYVTNNSTKTREEFAEKCKLLNFKASEENILCTSHLAANYLKNISFNRKVYVIGKSGITKELEKVGIAHCGTGPDPMGDDLTTLLIEKDPDVGAVIVGYDEHFSYPKMVKAASYLADHDVHFIGTNTDERFPTSKSIVMPGTGSFVRCIETCSERKATIMGKPEPYVADMIKQKYNVDPKRTLMIGDRANTDILLGTRCGFKTLLVLSGVTHLEEVEKWKQSTRQEDRDLVADYYIDTLGDLYPHLQKLKKEQKMAACKYLKDLSKGEFRKFLESFDVVLSDCDGVLWREHDVIEGSPETVVKLRELGKKFFYITNNNSKSRVEMLDKIRSHTYDVKLEEILCSSYLAAIYLKQLKFNKKVYLVGSEGISRELDAQGIEHVGLGPDVTEGDELDILFKFKPDSEVGAVVVGFDRHFSYQKIVKAATYAYDKNIHFICTNPDVERPSPNTVRYPGAGCFLSAIEKIAKRNAVILGKPEPFVSEIIKKKYGVDPARTLMIGDNLNTDILLGQRCGFTTLLVMSGITTPEELASIKKNPKGSPILPNFYADQLSDVLDCLSSRP